VGPAAAAHLTGVADGVVRGAEGSLLDEGHIRGKLVCHRVDAGDIQSFLYAHARQDARHGARQQGFTGTGRAYHQHVMAKRHPRFP
jgi:hypothetical protein